jgi:hypothetical protein
MAVGNVILFSANKDSINIDDLVGATINLALVGSAYTPDASVTGHDTWADVSAHEIAAANGYLAGGFALASPAKAAITNGFKFSTGNASWDADGGNIAAWRYGVLYVDGALWGLTDPLIGYFVGDDTPADYPATPNGSPLNINCPADGWLTAT